MNSADPATDAITHQPVAGIDIDIGWGLDLTTLNGFGAYLTTLRKQPRYNLRHDLDTADRAGLAVNTLPASNGDLDGFVRLARATAAKFGNSDYYQPGRFQKFVLALDDDAQLDCASPRGSSDQLLS